MDWAIQLRIEVVLVRTATHVPPAADSLMPELRCKKQWKNAGNRGGRRL